MKLRTNLLLLVLGIAIPLIAVAAVLVTLIVGSERDSSRTAATDRIRAFMSAVDAELRGTIGTVQALGASERLRARDLHAFRREALNVLASQPD